MADSARLLTSLDAAQLLRVHPKQIYRLLKRGLPALRVGDEWRFVRAEILEWAASRPARPGGAPTPQRVAAPDIGTRPSLLAANGDCAVEALLAAVGGGGGPLLGFVQADHVSAAALLSEGRVLIAGQHGPATASDALPRCARLHLVERQLGLASRRGTRIAGISAIAGRRLASRPRSAGIRRRLDGALEQVGIALPRAYRRAHEYASHRDVVLAIAAGRADVGLMTQAWASAAGFSFCAIASEAYELAIPASLLGDPRVLALCEAAQSKALRQRLRDDFGYDVQRTGEIQVGAA